MKTWLTLYQKIRAYFDGKRFYKATKNGETRYFFASSMKQAQAKFINWKITRRWTQCFL